MRCAVNLWLVLGMRSINFHMKALYSNSLAFQEKVAKGRLSWNCTCQWDCLELSNTWSSDPTNDKFLSGRKIWMEYQVMPSCLDTIEQISSNSYPGGKCQLTDQSRGCLCHDLRKITHVRLGTLSVCPSQSWLLMCRISRSRKRSWRMFCRCLAEMVSHWQSTFHRQQLSHSPHPHADHINNKVMLDRFTNCFQVTSFMVGE